MSNIVHFYHYTSEWGLEGIKSSGQINNSSQEKNHAHFGIGCYGTSLPPWYGKEEIAQNNWRDHGVFYIRNGKMEWALDVKIPRNKVRKVPWRNKRIHRDILVHNGPVCLDDYDWRALRVSENSDPHGEYRARSIPYNKKTSSTTTVGYSTDAHRYSFNTGRSARPSSASSYASSAQNSVGFSADTYRAPVVSSVTRTSSVNTTTTAARESFQPHTPARAYRMATPPPKKESSCTIL